MNIENIDIDYILSVLNTQLQHCCNCISEHGKDKRAKRLF